LAVLVEKIGQPPEPLSTSHVSGGTVTSKELLVPDLRWWVQKNLMLASYELVGHIAHKDGRMSVISSYTLTTLSKEESQDLSYGVTKPLRLSKESAQDLMDELWSTGLRPSNGAGNIGELAAVKHHLEDMRGLVKGFMEMKK
jgi:hypothetical protein